MKQNQISFLGTYSKLTLYFFHQKILRHFNDFQKFFFIKDFLWDIFKSDIMFHWSQNTKY